MSLSPGARTHLEEHGYAVVPGFYDGQRVAELKAAEERVAKLDGDPARLVRSADSGRLERVVWCEGLDPAFDGLGSHPQTLAVVREALGTDGDVVQLLQQLHPKVPGGELVYTPHQDASNRRFGTEMWRNPGPRGGFVQLVIALDPANADSGGLQLWPGSHRAGFVADPSTGVVPPAWRRPEDAVALSLAPGDLLVFGPFLVHGSPPNQSHHPRTLFIQGFTLPGVNARVYVGSGLGVHRG
mgnify:CR=1 FL=1